jgi:hypothetical protein
MTFHFVKLLVIRKYELPECLSFISGFLWLLLFHSLRICASSLRFVSVRSSSLRASVTCCPALDLIPHDPLSSSLKNLPIRYIVSGQFRTLKELE